MNQAAIEHAIRTATVSLEMEGFAVSPDHAALCRKMLAGEITLEEYFAQVIPKEIGGD